MSEDTGFQENLQEKEVGAFLLLLGLPHPTPMLTCLFVIDVTDI